MQNKVLVIAGMHRSGTSLVSNWLSRCGLHVGERLLGGDIGNVDGHFEDIDFYRFHEDTLEDKGQSRYGWVTEPVTELSRYQKEKLSSIIALKNKLNAQWGWKDPRTCVFFAAYRELLPGAYYLNVFRDYPSTVSSVINRDFKHHEAKYLRRKALSRFIWKNFRRKKRLNEFYRESTELYLKVWITYNEEILKNIKTLDEGKYIVADCRDLYDVSEDIFDHLKNQWGFDLQHIDFKEVFKDSLLSPPTSIDRFINDKSLIDEARQLEKRLKELCIKRTAP